MTISVCMGTYNGEKYIEEQLASILHQTVQPDEVILCDDNSADRTAEIICEFIQRNGLEGRWKLYRNEKNRGYPLNFYDAMELCSMETVFLADQDDVWDERKLEQMCGILEKHTEMLAVACKFGLIGADGKKIRLAVTPVRSGETGKLRKVAVNEVFYKCEWPGMVLAYRNEWYQKRSLVLRTEAGEERRKDIPHDFFVCAAAAEDGGFCQLDEELAFHRRHENNVGGEEHRLRKLLNKQRKLKEIEDYLQILDAFAFETILRTEDGQKALEEKRISMQGRYEALTSGKRRRVLQNACRNKGQVRAATLICDLLIVGK